METAVVYMERVVVLLLVRSIVADVCIKSVFLHSTTSMLPSSELFCIINENADKRAYDEPVAIASLNEFDRLIPLNHQRRFAKINLEDVVSISIDGMKLAFEYPTSIFSNKCIGTAFIPIGKNFSSHCNFAWSAFNSTECTKISFLSASYYTQNPFTTLSGNDSIHAEVQSNDIRQSQWFNELCSDIIKKVKLTFHMNGNNITNVTTEFIYDIVTRENFTNIPYQIEVFFEKHYAEIFKVVNNDEHLDGYNERDRIITSGGYLTLPFGQNCNNSALLEVRFGIDLTTGCEMIVSGCNSLRRQIKQLFARFEYSNISSFPSDQSSHATIFIENEPSAMDTSTIGCDLITSVTLEIGIVRQGDQRNFKWHIISVAYRYSRLQTYALDEYSPKLIPIVFFAHFIDLSPSTVDVFANFPTINLALPSDFFYPFLTSSSHNGIYAKFCLIIAIMASIVF